jgi:hypothetical protein
LTFLLLRDVKACQAVVEELAPIAERNKFPWTLAYIPLLRGWLDSQGGDRDHGIRQMLSAADEPSATNYRTMILAQVAEQQLRGGHLHAATATLNRATSEMQIKRFGEPEIVRLPGETLLAQSRDNAAEAEHAFRQAMASAAKQTCRVLELRAGLSLAKLLDKSGRRAEARDLLAPLYDAFTEGFAEPDLQATREILTALG